MHVNEFKYEPTHDATNASGEACVRPFGTVSQLTGTQKS